MQIQGLSLGFAISGGDGLFGRVVELDDGLGNDVT
jgi:hypothetical protein